jgi:hypothetical protein
VGIQQADQETVTVDLRLPVDMALTAMAPEQRLVEGPITLDVDLRQPDLGAFARLYKGLPQLAGTLQGRSVCRALQRNLASRPTCA